MPISASAKKSLRVAERKTSLNHHRKALIKAALKNVTAETYSKAVSMIDKGVKWNLFHQNKAARMKSALAKKLPAGVKIAPRAVDKTLKVAKTKTAVAKTAKKATTPTRQAQGKPATKKKTTKAKK